MVPVAPRPDIARQVNVTANRISKADDIQPQIHLTMFSIRTMTEEASICQQWTNPSIERDLVGC